MLDSLPDTRRLTWNELAARDHRLRQLEKFVLQQQLVRDDNYCANWVWYGLFKPILWRLVGFYRETERDGERQAVLTTPEAYETATRHLYELLPPCSHHDDGCRHQG